MPLRPARLRVAVALASAAAVATALMAPYSAPSASAQTGVRPAPSGEDTSVASRAQRQAVSAVTQARGIATGASAGDLTMALRDVANTRTALTGADRAAADELLARPTDLGVGDGTPLSYGLVREQRPVCSSDICVHWVATGANRSTRSYVGTVLATLTDVHDLYLRAGYREPRADATRGGDARIDVYLGQLGSQGLYGYCTSDQPETAAVARTYDRWAYCALDNDYAEFRTNTPLDNLRVTVAHEYFHATQYAYDRYEDAWLLEATATWAEDEVYDAVDDNRQYLPRSPLTQPRRPLDTFADDGFHYGTWTFVRHLTERYPARQGRLPRLVLDIFRRADGARGGPDDYSWKAVDAVLRAKRTTAAAAFARYSVANRRPERTYAEGRAGRYPASPLLADRGITATRGARGSVTLDHLTSATVRVRPEGLGAKARLRLALDLAPTVRGTSALLTTGTPAGRTTTRVVRLSPQGDALLTVPFGAGRVAWVEVTLVNASGRFACYTRGPSSCQGTSRDNRLPMRYAAAAVR